MLRRVLVASCRQGVPRVSVRLAARPIVRLHATQSAPAATAPADPAWVGVMNEAITKHPLETAVSFVALDAASIIGLSVFFAYGLHLDVPVDFAVAFGVSRLLRKFRLPLDAAVAAGLAKAYPPLTRVNITQAFRSLRKRADAPPPAAPVPAAGAATAAAAAAAAVPAPPAPVSPVRRALEAGLALVDRFGLAFLISQRMVVGLASVFGIYGLLRAGVDVQSALNALHIDIASAAGGAASKWAAAACAAAPLFPALVYGSAKIGTAAGRWRLAAVAAAAAKKQQH